MKQETTLTDSRAQTVGAPNDVLSSVLLFNGEDDIHELLNVGPDCSAAFDLSKTAALSPEMRRDLSKYRSAVLFAGDSSPTTPLEEDPVAWTEEVTSKLETVLVNVQGIADAMKAAGGGQIVLVWAEPDLSATAPSVQAGLNGAFTSMVKAFALDYAPYYMSLNAVVVPHGDALQSASSAQKLIALLASDRVPAMVGQILRPGAPSAAATWGIW